MKKRKFLTLVLLAILLVTIFAGCGSVSDRVAMSQTASFAGEYSDSKSAAYDMDNGFYSENSIAEESYGSSADTGEGGTESVVLNDSARKLIRTYALSVETEAFDDLMVTLDNKVKELGGYVEWLNTYNGSNYYSQESRYSNMTVRIPASKAEEFITIVGNTANITNQNLNVQDITLEYVDMESRKDAYEVEQERLLSFLEKAETVEEIISIESRLSEVRYQLESMESQLRTYDNLVDYSTISLSITEVKQYTAPEPEGYGERLWREFTDSLDDIWEGFKDVVVGFAALLPKFVVFGVIVLAIFLIISAIIKGGKKKKIKAEKLAKNNE